MENVTHSLVGLLLAQTGLNRWTRGATAVLVLSANVPDIDIVASAWGALRYLEVHRGYTHCLLGLPVMAALSALIVGGAMRRNIVWRRLWLLGCAGVASHLLLDWTNTYGVRLLLPFSSRWFHLDISNLWDGVILAALLVAVVWPAFSRLVSSEMGGRAGRGRGLAYTALVFYFFFECARGFFHARAVEQLSSRLYGGAVPTVASALPGSVNPLAWTGIVETADSFRGVDIDVNRPLDPHDAKVTYKPTVTGPIRAALTTEPFQFFRYFCRFPAWSQQPVSMARGKATRVDLTDLRFGAPGTGSFHAVALVDDEGHVLESAFTFGSGSRVGYGYDQRYPQ